MLSALTVSLPQSDNLVMEEKHRKQKGEGETIAVGVLIKRLINQKTNHSSPCMIYSSPGRAA